MPIKRSFKKNNYSYYLSSFGLFFSSSRLQLLVSYYFFNKQNTQGLYIEIYSRLQNNIYTYSFSLAYANSKIPTRIN